MKHRHDPNDIEPDHPGPIEPTWADVRDALRKALSSPPREFPITRQIEIPVQLPRTPQPVSFLRWCGQPAVHSAHGRCDGVR